MTLLSTTTKLVTIECKVNTSRDTINLVEQIAGALDIAIGEHDEHEWVRLVHLRTINVNRETMDAKTN